jgi:6-pyruvoyl-tetrahydropterin synthase
MINFVSHISEYKMASVIRVTREFSFEMAHALWNYDGRAGMYMVTRTGCFVTLSGTPVNDPENPKNGMVIDFKDLKKDCRPGCLCASVLSDTRIL